MPTDFALTAPPATILAICTSGLWCSTALSRHAGETLDVHEEPVGRAHSSRVLPMIDALLESAGVGLRDLRGVAFDAGPGAFTGLRISCSLAQGLGFGLGIPLVAIGSLDAIALGALEDPESDESDETGTTVITAIDARMGECYVAAFDAVREALAWRIDAIEPAQICPLERVGEWIRELAAREPGRSWIVAGDAAARFPAVAQAARAIGARCAAGVRPAAGTLARLAGMTASLPHWRPAAQARPLYVRDKVALNVDEQRELRRRNAAARQ